MAEEQRDQNKNVNRLHEGLHTDNAPQDQPKGTYRFALNGVNESDEGERGFLTNERGNIPLSILPAGFQPVGHTYTNDDRIFVLLANEDETLSQIGVISKDNKYTMAEESACLGFSRKHRIDVIYRLRQGCEDTIYFTDGINPVRYYNFAEPDDFDPADCDTFKLFRNTYLGRIDDICTIEGGQLVPGTYNFAIQYLDEDLNPTEWKWSSNLIPIFGPSLSDSYLNILGSRSTEVDPENGIEKTSKAIQLNLSELDEEAFPYYRIAVIEATGATGERSRVLFSSNQPTNQKVFIHDGNLEDYTEGSLSELRQVRADISTAEHIEQIENRLILSNIKGKQVNFCGFQRLASKIASRYVVTSSDVEELNDLGDPKNPKTYVDLRSYLGGEVYAFGIVFEYDDGFLTPAFHIPGRPKNFIYNLDTGAITTKVGASADDAIFQPWTPSIAHITEDEAGYNASPDIERWRVKDTADNQGTMAFWESQNVVYVDRETCDGGDYWGTDFAGLPLVNQPIRHHRFPSRETVGHYVNSDLQHLGIEFGNIEYPPGVVAHHIVRAERDEFNRTIVDKGISNSMRVDDFGSGEKYYTFSYFEDDDRQSSGNKYLFTPNFQYRNEAVTGQYLVYEGAFQLPNSDTANTFHTLESNKYKDAWTDDAQNVFIDTRRYTFLTCAPPPNALNRKIDKTLVIAPAAFDRTFSPTFDTYNLSLDNRMEAIQLNDAYAHVPDTMHYVSVRNERDVHSNLDGIKYYRTHNNYFENEENSVVYGGDIFISDMGFSNTLFREFYDGPLTNILIGLAILVAAAVTAVTFGSALPGAVIIAAIAAAAIGLTATSVGALIEAYKETNLEDMAADADLDNISNGEGFLKGDSMAYAVENIRRCYVESDINMGLREKNNGDCNDFFRNQSKFKFYAQDKLLYADEDPDDSSNNKLRIRGVPCPELYKYNEDYSRENQESIYFPLPSTYECCSDCLEDHPNRVHYSEQSFQEELSDNYRIFLPNNYRDIEGEHGSVTNVIRKHNNLIIHTEEAIWNLPQNIQERVTGDVTSFIGTGDFFSIPPRKIVDDDMGSAGSQHKWATNKTRHGVFFVDEREGKVYLFENQLEELSLYGNRAWFEENLKSFFGQQYYELTGENYECFTHIGSLNGDDGVGIHSTYDTRYNRIILTKKDFVLLDQYASNFFGLINEDLGVAPGGASVGQTIYNKDLEHYGIVTAPGVYQKIDIGDEDYFINKSWTVSFSLYNKKKVSFHSYIPNYYIHSKNNLYSFVAGSQSSYHYDMATFNSTGVKDASPIQGLWLHNADNFHNFYGRQYPHIIEYVSLSNPLTTRIWNDVTLQTTAKRYDSFTDTYKDERLITHDHITLYNSRQSSGRLQLIVKDSQASPEDYLSQQVTNNNPDRIIIDRNERNWNLNDFRDIVTDYSNPLFTKDWNSLRDNYYMDKVVNQSVINYSKDWTELESFRDKYLIIRLEFSNFDDVKLTTNYSIEGEQTSYR